MGLNILVFGKMIFSMVGAKKHGPMDLVSRVIMWMVKNMDKEHISGLTALVLQVDGLRTK